MRSTELLIVLSLFGVGADAYMWVSTSDPTWGLLAMACGGGAYLGMMARLQ